MKVILLKRPKHIYKYRQCHQRTCLKQQICQKIEPTVARCCPLVFIKLVSSAHFTKSCVNLKARKKPSHQNFNRQNLVMTHFCPLTISSLNFSSQNQYLENNNIFLRWITSCFTLFFVNFFLQKQFSKYD